MRKIAAVAALAAALFPGPALAAQDQNNNPPIPGAEDMNARRADVPMSAQQEQKSQQATQDYPPPDKAAAANDPIADSRRREKDALDDLAAKETVAADAVKTDPERTPKQKKAALAQLSRDFKAQKKAIRAKYRAERRQLERQAPKAP